MRCRYLGWAGLELEHDGATLVIDPLEDPAAVFAAAGERAAGIVLPVLTAAPAADGVGNPQVSWAVEAGGQRILHAGDTMFHGWWWRAALQAGPFDAAFLPINGAVLDFPWRQPASPLPAAMTPEQAGRALAATRVVPIHFGAFDVAPFYRSIADAPERFAAAAADAGIPAVALGVADALAL